MEVALQLESNLAPLIQRFPYNGGPDIGGSTVLTVIRQERDQRSHTPCFTDTAEDNFCGVIFLRGGELLNLVIKQPNYAMQLFSSPWRSRFSPK